MTMIGYARVSTLGQDLTIQVETLKACGCARIVEEKMSGRRTDRPKLCRLARSLVPGDVVTVTKLDRLARSSRDLLNIVHSITEAGAQFRSIADTWCDTTTPHGKLILTVMAGLAEFELDLIKSRTQAGIERARAKGSTFGRPVKLNARQKTIIAERYAKGETMQSLANDFEVAIATIHRALRATAA